MKIAAETHQHPVIVQEKWERFVEMRQNWINSVANMSEIAQNGLSEQDMIASYPEFPIETIRKIRILMDPQVEQMQQRTDPKPRRIIPEMPNDLRSTLDKLMGKMFYWISLPTVSDVELATQVQDLTISRTQEDLPIYWLMQQEIFTRREEGIFAGKTNFWTMAELEQLTSGMDGLRAIDDFPNKQAWNELMQGVRIFQNTIQWWQLELSDADPISPEMGKREIAFCTEIFAKYKSWAWRRAAKTIGWKSNKLEQSWMLRIHAWESREWTREELDIFSRFGTEKLSILRWRFPFRTTKAIEEKRNALSCKSSSSSDADIIGLDELEDAPMLRDAITRDSIESL
jgi:hypothetical protein